MTENDTVIYNMHIYPNPNNRIFTPTLDCKEKNNTILIRLLNITGKTVFEKKIETGGKQKIVIDAGNIPPGLYFMNITVNGINTNRKVIINK
ncbi:MAG: T9SS type A sorting domain-containing protein [Bacteroidetes bacterium]|nr:T9SS type A sorting domain-containing protein [Bacteroidota bacterium]